MKKDMALKWEKIQGRVVSNFKKKWIPFVMEFAQADLRKVNEAKLTSYRKGMKFLTLPFAERFDEDGFENQWRSGGYEKENMEIDGTLMKILLKRFQSRFKWISKYMGWKDKTDARQYPLHLVKTYSVLYIDRSWGRHNFVIKHDLDLTEQNQSARDMNKAVFFFMGLLDGLPVSSIRKCIGCDHYFLHLTKREKEYCNSACAGRSIQEGKREKLKTDHPRKHKQFLLEQKFRMGELRKGQKAYAVYLKKKDRDDWESYKQWSKLREKTVRQRLKKRAKK